MQLQQVEQGAVTLFFTESPFLLSAFRASGSVNEASLTLECLCEAGTFTLPVWQMGALRHRAATCPRTHSAKWDSRRWVLAGLQTSPAPRA